MGRCGVIKTRAVIKMCILHAELPGTLVYHRGERLVAACEQLAQSRASVVRAVNGGGLEQIIDRHLLALFEPYLRAAF